MHEFVKTYGPLLLATVIICKLAAILASHNPYNTLPLDLLGVVMPISLVTWVTYDARRRHATPCYDFGFLLLLCWYVSVPWYLLHSRGARGLLAILLFVGLFLAPYFTFVFTAIISSIR